MSDGQTSFAQQPFELSFFVIRCTAEEIRFYLIKRLNMRITVLNLDFHLCQGKESFVLFTKTLMRFA